eukprot:gene32997-42693_t
MSLSNIEKLADEGNAFNELLKGPFEKVLRSRHSTSSLPEFTILIDALDESKGCRIVDLLINLEKVFRNVDAITGNINFIITTRPDRDLLSKLQSHWQRERYMEFHPSELTAVVSPLLRSLKMEVFKKSPDVSPKDFYSAYSQLYDPELVQQYQDILEVMIAAFQSLSERDLEAMGLLEQVRQLPEALLTVQDHKWEFRHRSVKEWFLDSYQINAISGHTKLATYIWENVLKPWLIPYFSPTNEPPRRSYFRTYALDHLREANKVSEIEELVEQRPWQQAMLQEKGFQELLNEINSIPDSILPVDRKTSIFFQLIKISVDETSSIPSTEVRRYRSFVEQPNTIFVSHCHDDNAFVLLVVSLKDYIISEKSKPSEIFLLIDIFTIDPNKTTGELQDQLRRSSIKNDDNEFGLLVQALNDHFCNSYSVTRVRILIDIFAIDDIHTKAELQEELRHVWASVITVEKDKAVCPPINEFISARRSAFDVPRHATVEWEKIYIYIDTFCTDLNNAVMNTPSVLKYKEAVLFVFNGKVHEFSKLMERLDEFFVQQQSKLNSHRTASPELTAVQKLSHTEALVAFNGKVHEFSNLMNDLGNKSKLISDRNASPELTAILRSRDDKSCPSDFTILIDALDESKGCRIVDLLINLDRIFITKGTINFIVTTSPESPTSVDILSPLRKLQSHWQGKRYMEFYPSQLTEVPSPLLTELTKKLRDKNSTTTPQNVYSAYSQLFGPELVQPHQDILEVMVAAFQSLSDRDLEAMGLLNKARQLPEDWFKVQDHKWEFRHRSIKEWFLYSNSNQINAISGHSKLATYIWEKVLKPWLIPVYSPTNEPQRGSYFRTYALDHLREANKAYEIEKLLVQRPWQRAMFQEKGVDELSNEINTIPVSILPDDRKMSLLFQLAKMSVDET